MRPRRSGYRGERTKEIERSKIAVSKEMGGMTSGEDGG